MQVSVYNHALLSAAHLSTRAAVIVHLLLGSSSAVQWSGFVLWFCAFVQAKARAAGPAALAKFEEKMQNKMRQKEMRKRMVRM